MCACPKHDTAGLPSGGPAAVCQADGCWVSLAGKRPNARYCSRTCYHREWKRRRYGSMPHRWCLQCGIPLGRVRRDKRFCGPRCESRARRGGLHQEPPLSPYWREYLRRFDRALRSRTPEAWAAMHQLAPPTSGRGKPYYRELAALLRSLEAPH